MNANTETIELNSKPESQPRIAASTRSLLLLALWLTNVGFFLYYFFQFGFGDLQTWLGK